MLQMYELSVAEAWVVYCELIDNGQLCYMATGSGSGNRNCANVIQEHYHIPG